MFNKKSCPNCNRKVSKDYVFCPNCGSPIKKMQKKEDWGMLGKEDILEEPAFPSLFTGFGGKMMNKMLNNAMKMMEKEMQKNIEMQKKMPSQKQSGIKTNFELYINGKRVNPENIKITQHPLNHPIQNAISQNSQQKTVQREYSKRNAKNINFSQKNKNAFSKLERKEPKTSIRRLSNKIIYEIDVPDVESIENVSINQLENSIEIKAIGKKTGYEKIIPINFPISSYQLSEGKLILELKAN
jgi:hypothetical protein